MCDSWSGTVGPSACFIFLPKLFYFHSTLCSSKWPKGCNLATFSQFLDQSATNVHLCLLKLPIANTPKCAVWSPCSAQAPAFGSLTSRGVHVFPSCIRYDHCIYCTAFCYSINHGFIAGINCTRSNGDRVLATVICPSDCGQYVSIEYDAEGHRVSHPTAPTDRIATIQKPQGAKKPPGIRSDPPKAPKK